MYLYFSICSFNLTSYKLWISLFSLCEIKQPDHKSYLFKRKRYLSPFVSFNGGDKNEAKQNSPHEYA